MTARHLDLIARELRQKRRLLHHRLRRSRGNARSRPPDAAHRPRLPCTIAAGPRRRAGPQSPRIDIIYDTVLLAQAASARRTPSPAVATKSGAVCRSGYCRRPARSPASFPSPSAPPSRSNAPSAALGAQAADPRRQHRRVQLRRRQHESLDALSRIQRRAWAAVSETALPGPPGLRETTASASQSAPRRTGRGEFLKPAQGSNT